MAASLRGLKECLRQKLDEYKKECRQNILTMSIQPNSYVKVFSLNRFSNKIEFQMLDFG